MPVVFRHQGIHPVMPTQVGIHVFLCSDRQDVDDGLPAFARYDGWVSTGSM
jgi:hypothetical protein